MNKSTRYSPEVRERAVRLVFEHQGEHASQWATADFDSAPKIVLLALDLYKNLIDEGRSAGIHEIRG